VGIGLGTIFRFWAYRTHVFKPAEMAEVDEGPLRAEASIEPVAAIEAAPDEQSDVDGHNGVDGVETDEDRELQQELVQLELADIVDQAEQPVRQ
jgi:hypothetical protein